MGMSNLSEQALIGAMLHSPGQLVNVVERINYKDFSDPMAQEAFLIITGLWKQKKTVDAVSVISADTSLTTFIANALSNGIATGVGSYASQVALNAKSRRINASLTDIMKNGLQPDGKLDELLKLYQKEMFVTRKNPGISSVLKRFSSHVKENQQRGSSGIPTGFGFLEKKYIQYVPAQIWTIGAFTSVGKTAVMVQKICNLIALSSNPSIVVISTEMTEQQIIARILSNFTSVHSFRILAGDYRAGEEEKIQKYTGLIKSKNISIYDDIYTIGDIETVFRKADLQGGVDVGFIDYVQNCQVPDAKSSYQEGSILAKRIQKLAKDVMATMICLSQVSNDVGRGNTEQLELKGAGEWAAVSDLGVMLQRKKEQKYLLRYQIKKNRHGALHDQPMEYKADFTRIEETEKRAKEKQ